MRTYTSLAAKTAMKGIHLMNLVHSQNAPMTSSFNPLGSSGTKTLPNTLKVVHTIYAGPIYELLATYDAAEESVFVPKACVVCDTKLSTSRQFHDHVKAHIDIKKIICVVCGKRFNFFSVLRVIRLFVKTLNRLIDMRIYFNDGQPCVFTATLDRSFKEGQFRNTSYSMQNMRHNAAESS